MFVAQEEKDRKPLWSVKKTNRLVVDADRVHAKKNQMLEMARAGKGSQKQNKHTTEGSDGAWKEGKKKEKKRKKRSRANVPSPLPREWVLLLLKSERYSSCSGAWLHADAAVGFGYGKRRKQ